VGGCADLGDALALAARDDSSRSGGSSYSFGHVRLAAGAAENVSRRLAECVWSRVAGDQGNSGESGERMTRPGLSGESWCYFVKTVVRAVAATGKGRIQAWFAVRGISQAPVAVQLGAAPLVLRLCGCRGGKRGRRVGR